MNHIIDRIEPFVEGALRLVDPALALPVALLLILLLFSALAVGRRSRRGGTVRVRSRRAASLLAAGSCVREVARATGLSQDAVQMLASANVSFGAPGVRRNLPRPAPSSAHKPASRAARSRAMAA